MYRETDQYGEVVLQKLLKRRDPVRLNVHYFRVMWSSLGAARLDRCVEICDAGMELAYRIGPLSVQYPSIKAMALMELGLFSDAWQSIGEDYRRSPAGKRNSFPSAHTSGATVAATLAARNIEYLGISDAAKIRWQRGYYGLAGLTGWARMEANRHYPSDVLFVYALGHFFASFLNGAFVNPESQATVCFDAAVVPGEGFVLNTHFAW